MNHKIDAFKLKKQPEYELLRSTIELEGTIFPEHLREELYNPRDKKGSEGPGERLYRRTYGLDEKLVGSPKGRDIPEHDGKELKSVYMLQSRAPTKKHPQGHKVAALTHFRAGQHASDALTSVRWDVAWRDGYRQGWDDRTDELQHYLGQMLANFDGVSKFQTFVHITPTELKELVMSGLSMTQMAKLPDWARKMIYDAIKPSVGLADCTGGIGICIPVGHFDVMPSDYDVAFVISSVSKGLVCYKLARAYVERRQQLALARSVQPIPDRVAIESLRQVVNERQAIIVR